IALSNIDEVVSIIRAAESTADAKQKLQARFELSEIQAQQILDMPLKRLTGLERKALDDEHTELTTRIAEYQRLSSDVKAIDEVAIQELQEISDRFGDD